MNKIYSAVKILEHVSHSVTYTGDYFSVWNALLHPPFKMVSNLLHSLWFMCHLLQESILDLFGLSKSDLFCDSMILCTNLSHLIFLSLDSLIDLGFLERNLFILHL